MGRARVRVLVGLVLSLGLVGASAFVLDWFTFRVSVPSMADLAPTLATQESTIDLHAIHSCTSSGVCASVPLSGMKGAYPTLATGTFWLAMLLLALVLLPAVQRLTGNSPSARLTKAGYFTAIGVFLLGGLAGYLFSPETQQGVDVSIEVTRTWAPFMLLMGCLTSGYTLFKAQFGDSLYNDADYKPIKIAPKDDDENDSPPITDAPKRDARPKQLLTPGGSQPLSKVPEATPRGGTLSPNAKLADEIPLPPPRSSSVRMSSSIPLDEGLAFDLGATGGDLQVEDPKSRFQMPDIALDPSTPSIPLAAEDDAMAVARTKSATLPPIARTKPPSVQPIMERPTVPTIPPPVQQAAESGLSMRAQRPSSSPPLTEGGVVVRMRPPTNPPVAQDTPRKGTPGQGVVIRAKPPTAPPLLEGPRRGTPSAGVPQMTRSKTPGQLPAINLPPDPEVVVPAALVGKLRYATLTATLTHVGIEARREDGFARTVMWPDVVGIVARRLPPDEPWEGATFVDIVSTAGATLRVMPWTRLAGERIDGEGVERARAFVQLAAARCPSAKLDAATRTFLGSHGQAAQLPDEPTLAAHDRRLS